MSVLSLRPPAMRPMSAADLDALYHFVGLCARESAFATNLHPGDVGDVIANKLRTGDMARHFFGLDAAAWDAAVVPGAATLEPPLAGVVVVYPADDPAIDVMIHPHLHDDGTLRAALFAWAEAEAFARYAPGPDGEAPAFGFEILPGAPTDAAFLTARGYTAGDPLFTFTSQPLDSVPPVVLPPGYTVRPGTPADALGMGAVFEDAFRRWPAASYAAVVASPAFRFASPWVAEAPDGSIAACVIAWHDPVSRSGLFEPVACSSAHRRLGLTRALLMAGTAAMRTAGLTTAIVKHDPPSDNPAAAALYAACGFVARAEAIDYQLTRG